MPTNELKDHELVVFEKLYDLKGNLIAKHEDLEDQDQTVKVPAAPPEVPPKVVITGDENRPGLYFALVGISLAALMTLSMLLVHLKKRKD